jgi:predicted transporter
MTSFALLDGIYFLLASITDLAAVVSRRGKLTRVTGPAFGFLVNALYPFWPYVVIGGYLLYDSLKGSH